MRTPFASFRVAAALLFLAVALGAFGAHGLKPRLEANGLAAVWDRAALYHFLHALALLGLATLRPLPVVPWRLLATGVVLFSGSLYALAFTGLRWLGAITPVGGVCFLAGWLWLAWRPPGLTPNAKEVFDR